MRNSRMKGLAGAFLLTVGFLPSVPAADGDCLRVVLERRAGWLQKAEAAKPKLVYRDVKPVRTVRIARDAAAFQGWRAEDAGPCESVFGRGLRPGDACVFDFGEHLVGRLSFRLGEAKGVMDSPCRLKFTFAELPAELTPLPEKWIGLCRSWFPDETMNFDFAPADYALPRRYAFRYVKVEVVACARDVPALSWVKATAETSADASKIVPWTAPNEMAGRIDRVAHRTLRDCMQTMFEDGPKRDRRLWLGDLRLEALADYETYRNFDIVRRSLYLLAGTAKDNGLVGTDAYEQPFPKPGGCRIYDYTALFPTVVLEYLDASGDRETAEDLWPLCRRQAELVLTSVDAGGLVQTTGDWWYFIDHDKQLDRQVPEQGVVIFGLRNLRRLGEALGHADEVAYVPAKVAQMTAAARAKLWNATRGVYLGERETAPSWMGQAWMVLAGVPSAADARRCLVSALDDATAERPRTPYGYHYLIESLYVAGLRDRADELLLSYWGGMIEKGADTFWEAYVPGDDQSSPYRNAFLNSACHAWSCGPSYLLRNARYRALSK